MFSLKFNPLSFGLKRCLVLGLIGSITTAHAATGSKPNDEKLLHLYSSRQEQLLEPLLKAYTQKTGVRFAVLSDKEAPLIERLSAEGAKSPADIFIAVDAGNLWNAANRGLLASSASKVLNERIDPALRDPDGQWYALTRRVRGIVYHPDRVKVAELGGYDQLAQAKWKGRICLRSSSSVYNQSLVAMLIHKFGDKKVEELVRGWVTNLATEPFANDTSMIEAIAAGQCDLGVSNHYYLGRLYQQNPQYPVRIHFPTAAQGSSHVNITGAGIVASSQKKDLSLAFLEWLLSDEAQGLFVNVNTEYPVMSKDVSKLPAPLGAWGNFDADSASLVNAGRLQSQALRLMDKAGYR